MPSVQKTRTSDAHESTVCATAGQRHKRAGCQTRHHGAGDVHGAAVVVEPGRHLDKLLARQVGGRIEQMGARIKHKATARQCRFLAPGAAA